MEYLLSGLRGELKEFYRRQEGGLQSARGFSPASGEYTEAIVVASLLSWLRRRALWPPRLRQQVTRTGLAYTVTLLVVALIAFVSANNLMFLILAAMLSTFMISGFISKLGLAGLELELFLPQHISARRKVRAGVRLKNMKPWIPSFSIHLEGAAQSGFDTILYFPVLPGGSVVEEVVDVYFTRRGAHKERSFQFSTRFPFGFAERRELVNRSVSLLKNVETDTFDGLLVEYVERRSGQAILRGLRAVSDFEFEFQLALMNRKLNERVETIFMMPKDTYTFLSSRIVKEIARLGGDVSAFVPPHVREALTKKLAKAR